MTPEQFRKLAALGLTHEQMAGVLEVFDDGLRAEEERKAKGRERWHRWNDKRKANVSKHEQTLANDSCASATRGEDNLQTQKISGKDKKQDSLGACAPQRDFFAEFWLAYPRREGPNPKKPAKLAFERAVARGMDPERLIEAARALRKEHPVPTRFVPQAVTWLNQDRAGDDEPVVHGDEFCPDDWFNTRFLVIRFRDLHSGHDPPRAVQGGKAGYLIPAEWVAQSRNAKAENYA